MSSLHERIVEVPSFTEADIIVEQSPVKLFADILSDSESLISALKNNSYPDEAEEVYEYLPGQHHLTYLPSAVRDWTMTRELQLARLTLGHSADASSLTIEFEANDDSALYISRSSDIFDKLDTPDDALIAGTGKDVDIYNVPRIPTTEINRFIFSLLQPSKTGDYSQADNLELLDVSVPCFEEVMRELKSSAPSYSTRNTYHLSAPHENSSIYYQEDNGSLSQLTIVHALTDKQAIIAHIDCARSMEINFWNHNLEDGTSHPMSPDTSDLLIVREFVAEALENAHPPVEESLDGSDWEGRFLRGHYDI